MNTDQRPTAADFMLEELYYDNSVSEYDSDDDSVYDSDLDYDSDESYDSFNSTKIFDMKEHFRSLEMNRIRLLIQGKYELEEGEILTAFESISDEEQIACELAISYIRILHEFKQSSNLSEFILDTVDNLKLNSSQALKIHNVLMNEII